MDELVALVDPSGRLTGTAPRSVMRRDNLHHAATGVLVRNTAGDVYVHRRTSFKDVYPGLYDFTSGGVILAGEDPYDAAVRELSEELGITGIGLTPLGEGDYRDEFTWYRAFLYTCTYDGPVRHQPEEVDWGAWVSPEDVVRRIDDGSWRFVPDATTLLTDYLRSLVRR